jgi:hypothetical protein
MILGSEKDTHHLLSFRDHIRLMDLVRCKKWKEEYSKVKLNRKCFEAKCFEASSMPM